MSSPSCGIHRGRLDKVMKHHHARILPKFLSKTIFKKFRNFRKIFSFFRFWKFSDFFDFEFRNIFSFPYDNNGMKMKNISKLKNLEFFEIWKMKIFPENFQICGKSFLIKCSATFEHDDASSLYPISRDEFRTTATIFRFVKNVL